MNRNERTLSVLVVYKRESGMEVGCLVGLKTMQSHSVLHFPRLQQQQPPLVLSTLNNDSLGCVFAMQGKATNCTLSTGWSIIRNHNNMVNELSWSRMNEWPGQSTSSSSCWENSAQFRLKLACWYFSRTAPANNKVEYPFARTLTCPDS